MIHNSPALTLSVSQFGELVFVNAAGRTVKLVRPGE